MTLFCFHPNYWLYLLQSTSTRLLPLLLLGVLEVYSWKLSDNDRELSPFNIIAFKLCFYACSDNFQLYGFFYPKANSWVSLVALCLGWFKFKGRSSPSRFKWPWSWMVVVECEWNLCLIRLGSKATPVRSNAWQIREKPWSWQVLLINVNGKFNIWIIF